MYSEEQQIDSKFIKIIFGFSTVFSFLGIILAINQAKTEGDISSLNSLYFVAVLLFVLMLLVYLMIFRTTLELRIDSAGVSIRYFPFIRKEQTITYNTVVSWRMRQLKSVFEYGGVGYKKKLGRKQIGFIMGGNTIFELVLIDGKTVSFTAANSDMLYQELKKYIPTNELK